MSAPSNRTNASAVLLEANNDACLLLDKLNSDPKVGNSINQYLINSSRALIFTNTVKAGIGLGMQGGSGFMIVRLTGDRWSAPCFITLAAAQAGAIFGVEKTETLMAVKEHTLVREVCEGRSPVLGSDLNVQVWPLTSGTQGGLESMRFIWDQTSVMSISSSQGVIFDYSFKGGAIRPYTSRNAEVYGDLAATKDILLGNINAPQEFVPLYDKLNALASGKDGGVPPPASASA
ncbi:hypothetical protein N2152v2_005680 [Parachlorella kessleri]